MFYNNSYLGMHFIWWVVWALVIIWFVFWPFGSRKRGNKKDEHIGTEKKRILYRGNSILEAETPASKSEITRSRQIVISQKNGKPVFGENATAVGPLFNQTTNN